MSLIQQVMLSACRPTCHEASHVNCEAVLEVWVQCVHLGIWECLRMVDPVLPANPKTGSCSTLVSVLPSRKGSLDKHNSVPQVEEPPPD